MELFIITFKEGNSCSHNYCGRARASVKYVSPVVTPPSPLGPPGRSELKQQCTPENNCQGGKRGGPELAGASETVLIGQNFTLRTSVTHCMCTEQLTHKLLCPKRSHRSHQPSDRACAQNSIKKEDIHIIKENCWFNSAERMRGFSALWFNKITIFSCFAQAIQKGHAALDLPWETVALTWNPHIVLRQLFSERLLPRLKLQLLARDLNPQHLPISSCHNSDKLTTEILCCECEELLCHLLAKMNVAYTLAEITVSRSHGKN